MTRTTTTTPPPALAGRRAATIVDRITGCDEGLHLEAATRLHPEHWATFPGVAVIARLDAATDAEPLFREAIRLLALATAGCELTGNPAAAALTGPAPVEGMVRAVLAQHTLCHRLTQRLGITLAEPRGDGGYRPGDHTHRCYLAAGWGEPDPRFWLDADETARRLAILTQLYASIGIHAAGQRHDLRFTPQLTAAMVGI